MREMAFVFAFAFAFVFAFVFVTMLLLLKKFISSNNRMDISGFSENISGFSEDISVFKKIRLISVFLRQVSSYSNFSMAGIIFFLRQGSYIRASSKDFVNIKKTTTVFFLVFCKK